MVGNTPVCGNFFVEKGKEDTCITIIVHRQYKGLYTKSVITNISKLKANSPKFESWRHN